MKIEFEKLFSKKNKSNPFLTVSAVFCILFFFMIVNIFYFLMNDSYDVICNSYNTARTTALAKQNIRGTIFSRDNEALAYTQTDAVSNAESRIYPYDKTFSHIVGFLTNGRMGLESIGNMSLSKSDVTLKDKIKNDMEGKKNPGDDIYTTLSVPLQKAAYEAMGNYDGAIIVMNPKTGEILAMVSKPDFSPYEIESIWDETIQDENSSILLNRATQGLYPPGSVFKIVDTIEYLRENNNDISTFTYDCSGSVTFEDDSISCYHNNAHGTVDFYMAFAKSCNCAFANIGSSFNKKQWANTLFDLMFQSDLPLQLPYSKSNVDINPQCTSEELLQTAIGQGTMQMTPMHVALITSAIADKGMLMKPIIISSVKSKDRVIKVYEQEEYKQLLSAKESEVLCNLMTGVINDGTAEVLKNDYYQVAGKTGSAEYDNSDKGKSHAWFSGFAPANDPEIVVTVILENGGSGGKIAAGAAKSVFDAYFSEFL